MDQVCGLYVKGRSLRPRIRYTQVHILAWLLPTGGNAWTNHFAPGESNRVGFGLRWPDKIQDAQSNVNFRKTNNF